MCREQSGILSQLSRGSQLYKLCPGFPCSLQLLNLLNLNPLKFSLKPSREHFRSPLLFANKYTYFPMHLRWLLTRWVQTKEECRLTLGWSLTYSDHNNYVRCHRPNICSLVQLKVFESTSITNLQGYLAEQFNRSYLSEKNRPFIPLKT